MIENVGPQGFPLYGWTPQGGEVLVVGWAEPADDDRRTGAVLAPVVVELDGKSVPRVLEGPVAYFRPAT